MATHSSILAWSIPGTEEPGGLPSVESQSQTRLSGLPYSLAHVPLNARGLAHTHSRPRRLRSPLQAHCVPP